MNYFIEYLYSTKNIITWYKKFSKDQLKQTRKSLNETRVAMLELLEIYKKEEEKA